MFNFEYPKPVYLTPLYFITLKDEIFQSDNWVNTITPEKKFIINKKNLSIQGENTEVPSILFRGHISDYSGFISAPGYSYKASKS